MRRYERSHPWLTFQADLSRAPPSLWMLLGEARSKCEHLAGVALRPAAAEHLHEVYLAKGVNATTAIEGNTLSEEQVRLRLEGKLQLPKSKEYLGQEVDNVLEAINVVGRDVIDGKAAPLTPDQIKEFNRLVLKDLEHGPEVVPGETRTHSVEVGTYLGSPAEDCDYLLERLCDWLNGESFEAPTLIGDTGMALLKAILAHLYLAWIHPFGDGNGRTARLVELKLLVEAGLPSPAAHLLSNHYNETRSEYYRQLDRASKSGGDVVPFVEYAIQGFVDQMREQIKLVRGEQLHVAWLNYVYEHFQDKHSSGEQRKRRLVLELSQRRRPIPRHDLTALSPELAREYANRTSKTLSRDLNDLIKEKLLHGEPDGTFRAAWENILAFLPRSTSGRAYLEAVNALASSRLFDDHSERITVQPIGRSEPSTSSSRGAGNPSGPLGTQGTLPR